MEESHSFRSVGGFVAVSGSVRLGAPGRAGYPDSGPIGAS